MTDPHKSWLVTGASGFLGTNFTTTTDALVALTRSDNLPNGYYSNVVADLEDEQQLRDAFHQVKPDYILHAAAMSSHEECELDPRRAFHINEQIRFRFTVRQNLPVRWPHRTNQMHW